MTRDNTYGLDNLCFRLVQDRLWCSRVVAYDDLLLGRGRQAQRCEDGQEKEAERELHVGWLIWFAITSMQT